MNMAVPPALVLLVLSTGEDVVLTGSLVVVAPPSPADVAVAVAPPPLVAVAAPSMVATAPEVELVEPPFAEPSLVAAPFVMVAPDAAVVDEVLDP
jgi:hypothetical protein